MMRKSTGLMAEDEEKIEISGRLVGGCLEYGFFNWNKI